MSDRAEDFDLADPNPEAMVARARAKWESVESGAPLKPAGWFVGRIVACSAVVLLLTLPMLFGAFALLTGDRAEKLMAALLGIPGALFTLILVLKIAQSRANSPRNALALFYRFLGRGRTKAAQRLVIPDDFDSFPRWFPEFDTGGREPVSNPSFFDEPGEFGGYWKALLRWPVAGYCLVGIKSLRVEEITPDISVCRFDLRLGINTQLWALLILVPYWGIVIALIVDAITRRRFSYPMTKILVRAENEWLLFNGAFHEADEEDTTWLSDGETAAEESGL